MIANVTPILRMATEAGEDRRNPVAPAIAQHLLEDFGDSAHFEALSRVGTSSTHDKLWRDVLFYLDELTNERKEP